jgi:hypothetical protein
MADKDFGKGDNVEWKSHGQKVKGPVKETITDETWRDATSNSAPHLSRVDTIGQAKGMLMERFNIDAAAPFWITHARFSRVQHPRCTNLPAVIAGDHPLG